MNQVEMAMKDLFEFEFCSNSKLAVGYKKKGGLWRLATQPVGGYELVGRWL